MMGGEPVPIINKGRLGSGLVTSLVTLQDWEAQEGWYREKQMRIKLKGRENPREGCDFNPRSKNLGYHLSLGGDFWLGPQLSLGLRERGSRHGVWLSR